MLYMNMNRPWWFMELLPSSCKQTLWLLCVAFIACKSIWCLLMGPVPCLIQLQPSPSTTLLSVVPPYTWPIFGQEEGAGVFLIFKKTCALTKTVIGGNWRYQTWQPHSGQVDQSNWAPCCCVFFFSFLVLNLVEHLCLQCDCLH